MFEFLFKKEDPVLKAARLERAKKDKELALFMANYKVYLECVAGEQKDQEILPVYWNKLKNYEKSKWLKVYLKRELLEDYIRDKRDDFDRE
jgi:hypothetical protein